MRLIDADKSTEILKSLLYETAFNNSGEASMMCEDIAEHRLKTWIDLVPTEAEPIRHGHWMLYEFAMNNRWRKCSVCGTADEYINNSGLEAIRRYCPYCGAKMDEVERENDVK